MSASTAPSTPAGLPRDSRQAVPPWVSLLVLDDERRVGQTAAELLLNRLAGRPASRLLLPTGATPLPMYAALRAHAAAGLLAARSATAFQLDEYRGLAAGDPHSYRAYLRRELSALGFGERHELAGDAADVAAECARYQALLDAAPIDLAVLGLGRDGHVAFDEPGSLAATAVREVALHGSTRADAARDFGGLDRVPERALTVGLRTLLAARELLVLVTGRAKAPALRRMLHEPPSPAFPASLLRSHPRLTVLCDRAAAAELPQSHHWDSDHVAVVLGHREPGNSEEHRISSESLQRLHRGERLARAVPTRAVLLTGYTSTGGRSEAEQMDMVWSVGDVPRVLEVAGRDTAENATRTLPLIVALGGIRRVTVVTSAWHLRAPYFFAPFRGFGLELSFRTEWRGGGWLRLLANELRLVPGAPAARRRAFAATRKHVELARPLERSVRRPTSDEVAEALRDPSVYGVAEVELRETHISWVYLAGERAYKLKKPVRLPFVDYGTEERRREMCEEEVRLNRRLAPDLYLGVRAVVPGPARFAFERADHPDAVEHVVEMRRFDERRTLAALVERGERPPMGPLAGVLARFHERTPAVAMDDAAGALRAALDENTATIRELAGRGEAWVVDAMDRFARSYLAAHGERIARRAAAGRVRDGHGDLRSDHVVLADGPVVVDCVEFAPHLRQVDTANDLSYLVMDLVARGAATSANELLDAYRSAGGDVGDDGLVAFFATYRALVAAKVAFLRGEPEQLAAAAAHLSLAQRFSWQARLPLVLVLCGVSASGKSYLARELAQRTGATVISSDELRKRRAGVAEGARLGPQHYTEEARERVYDELGELAARVLSKLGGVIVDATFHRRSQREAFAASLGETHPVFVQCRAAPDVLRRRAERRVHDPARVSDATVDVVERQLAESERFAESVATVDTDQPLAGVLDAVYAALDSAMRERPARDHRLGAIPG